MRILNYTKYFFCIVLFICLSSLSAQDKPVNFNEADYITEPVEHAVPSGGLEAIRKNVTYPEDAKENKIEGKVFVKAFIDEKGDVVFAEIIDGVKELNEAALNAVKKTKFIPGKVKSKAVKTQITVPIAFKLK